jgi:hypothetical protein
MIQMDKNSLLQKLRVLETDSLHKAVISWDSNTEVGVIKHFVSTYDGLNP